MTQTRWLGGPDKSLMPLDVVSATYNLVENEIPVAYPAFYDYAVRSVYKTELAYKSGSLIVKVGNTEVEYLERGSANKEFEIRNRFVTGYLRFFYTPKETIDFYGTERLSINKTRTWINQKFVVIDRDIINQIRIAVSAIENQLNLVATRWTGGTFADVKGTVTGTANELASFKSNIYNEQTLYVSGMFKELSDQVQYLADRVNVSTVNETALVVTTKTASTRWLEDIRTVINNIEKVI